METYIRLRCRLKVYIITLQQYNLEYAYLPTYIRTIKPSATAINNQATQFKNLRLISAFTMRVAVLALNLRSSDPQPRDGGAPNPGVRPMMSSSTMRTPANDGSQPRDGG
ncbi:hypothetical protein ACN47E_001196 [Coniothyrium glycines]